jgi:hypothetical protein
MFKCGKKMETFLALPVTAGSESTERQNIPPPRLFDEPEGACESFSTGSASFKLVIHAHLNMINPARDFLAETIEGFVPHLRNFSSGRILANRHPGLKCF